VHPDLEFLALQFAEAEARMHQLAESVSEATWATRPPDGGWSMDECVAHLTLTNRRYVPILAEASDAAPAFDDEEPSRSMHRDLAGRLLTWMMEPPVRFRLPTRSEFLPQGPVSRSRTVAEFDAAQAAIQQQLRAMDGLDITRIRVTSPFNASLRYSAYSALHILVAHERRHLWQAERVRDLLRKQAA
jgi:hypothetical protein